MNLPVSAVSAVPAARRRLVLHAAALLAAAPLLVPRAARAGSYDDFFTALIRDDGDTITALVRRGFDPNTPDPKGQVGLVVALHNGSMRAFAALVAARGVKVEARNAQDESALMIAAIKGNVDAVRTLIARDADVNKTGWTPLHYAAAGTTPQQTEVAALLLENHAYIDAPSPNGTTPLMMAVRYGTADTAVLLVKEGADPMLKNKLGLTAYDFATQAGRRDMAEMLALAMRRRQPNRGRW